MATEHPTTATSSQATDAKPTTKTPEESQEHTAHAPSSPEHPVPEKVYYSYAQIHHLITKACLPFFKTHPAPDLLVPISGGGLIPARILRTIIRAATGKQVPMRTIGLELYSPEGEMLPTGVKRLQWLEWSGVTTQLGHEFKRILIVDEVDDTRTTLAYAVKGVMDDLKKMGMVGDGDGEGSGVEVGVMVVHNKKKKKRADLPEKLMKEFYIAAADIEDKWVVYPWDAVDIYEHEAK
ncbi:hypoxanthine-guanine phosphoribosyltransferase, partial [Quaeritorhiza haematococci]